MSGLDLMQTVTASTKRSGSTQLASVAITPLAAVDADTAHDVGLAAYTTRQTFVDGDADILQGDRLVVSSVEYPVRAVELWPWLPLSDTRKRVIVEVVL